MKIQPLRVPLLMGGTQPLYIQHVLFPSGRQLVLDEMISRDDCRSDLVIDSSLDSVFPCCIEADAIYALKDIDPCRGLANLEVRAVLKVGGGQAVQRSAVLGQSPKYRLAVFCIAADENVQVLCCAWLCMNAVGIAAYDEIFNSVIVERA